MNWITRQALLTSVLAVSFAAAGCQQSGGGGSGGRREGGASSGATRVPGDAARVDQTVNGRLIQRMQRPGTIYVQDATTGGVIYSGKVRADSNVVIDSKADAVTINDIQVRHAPKLNADHQYRLFFKQD